MAYQTGVARLLRDRAMDRREFLRAGGSAGLAALLGSVPGCAGSPTTAPEEDGGDRTPAGAPSRPVRFGYMGDVHFSIRPRVGNRMYNQSLEKAEEAVGVFNAQSPDFILLGGDHIDHRGYSRGQAISDLESLEQRFAELEGKRHYVLGNHCLDCLSKATWLEYARAPHTWYSWDQGGIHFVVLDACFRADDDQAPYDSGNFQAWSAWVPPSERAWLREELANTPLPVVIFCHHPFDDDGGGYIDNAAEIREIVRQSGNVMAVFAGHRHVNDLRLVDGIPHFTMMAAVEGTSNAFAMVTLRPNGEVRVQGWGSQADFASPGTSPAAG